jgi:hypothetical protein
MTPTDISISHPRHDPLVCPQCEQVSPNIWRRHWKTEPPRRFWHVIADGPDLMARLPKSAHFLTILAYLPGPDDQPSHYRGAFYMEGDADDPADVQKDMRRYVEILQVEYDISPEAIRLWLSGGRSFHSTIPPHVIGSDEGHPFLPDIYARMIDRLFPPAIAPTLDRGIYNRGMGRMWRLPNRRRTDTNRYKVPITLAELLHKPYIDLDVLTAKPRKGVFWSSEDELSPCPGLVQLYQEARAQVEADAVRAQERRGSGTREGSSQDSAGVLFHLFQARGWIDTELAPGKWNVLCPWAADHTKGDDFDTSTVLFAPRTGEEVGWWHCSHAHCEGRNIHDVLALFTPEELASARLAAGVTTFSEKSEGRPRHMIVGVV